MNKLIVSTLIATIIAISTAFTISPDLAYANENIPIKVAQETQSNYEVPVIPRPRTLPGPQEGEVREQLTQRILPNLAVNLVGFVSMAALLWLIIAGVRFATAYGNEERVESAKKQVIFALAGLVISLLAYSIVTIIIRLDIIEDERPQQEAPTQEEQPIIINDENNS